MTFERVQALAADTQWRRTQGVGFARHLQTVPLVAVELPSVVLSLPVAIVPEGFAGWRVVALMGAVPGSNACVGSQGQWLSRHVPAALRGHPFVWQTDGDGLGELALLSAAMVLEPSSAPGLEPVWAEDGRLSPQVLRVQSFLQQVEQGVQALSVAAAQLHGAGLLELWDPDGAVVPPVVPWHRVKESALNALPNAEFAALRASGALALAYAQMLSTGQWPMVQRLGKLSQQIAPSAPAQARAFVDPSAHSFLQSLAESQD
ncbi:MAG: SapC family protein [Polaromonas sp.]|nr:SapC family protein [Polaromonas sp.]